MRPTGENLYLLLNDLTKRCLPASLPKALRPRRVRESPGSFQAWLWHTQPLTKELSTLAAKSLARQFHADASAAYWRSPDALPA